MIGTFEKLPERRRGYYTVGIYNFTGLGVDALIARAVFASAPYERTVGTEIA